jgi:hypothetical protein
MCAALPVRAEDVVEAWRGGSFSGYIMIGVNAADGSVWAGDSSGKLVHLAGDGAQLWQGQFNWPVSVSVNATDGSVWIANEEGIEVVHLAADGTVLWRGGTFTHPRCVSVNQTDGSCWVADEHGTEEVVHLAADGTELCRAGGFLLPPAVSVNSADGSCWVGDRGNNAVVHLDPDGTEVWRGGSYPPGSIWSVAANPSDGSCWVGAQDIVHLAADGQELSRTGGSGWTFSVSVNSTDGSCWVGNIGSGELVHLAADGSDLWRSPVDYSEGSVSVNPTDGSCWVGAGDQLVHLVIVGTTTFPDIPAYHWAYDEIEACVDANVVKGYTDGLYHPSTPVTRDQMAVYISRALVSPSGDAAIPDPPATPSFSDVPETFWAYKHIEYAVSQNVVKGYEDGTYQPGVTVDRGQMAVYVARAIVAPGGDAAIPDPVPPATFPDVPDSFWAYKQVEYCVGQGVVTGYEDGNYHPDYPVTRDQMAVYIARAFGLL